MPLFSNVKNYEKENSIKFSYKEIEDKVTSNIKAALEDFVLEDRYYRLVFSHSYHQVLGVLDELFERNSTTSTDFVLPDYGTDENDLMIIKKPLLKNYHIKKDKDAILSSIEAICNATVLNGVKGVSEYVHRKKRW